MAQTGQYVGPYRLLNLLGNGKSCQVWEAMHDVKSLRLAVKLIVPLQRKEAEPLRLMQHEYTVGRQMDHPHIIQIFDVNTTCETPYLAMEFFGPANLKQAITSGTELGAAQLKKIIEQAADALGYFHKRGWIHRDVKSDNFLIDDKSNVKLIDFALARRKKGVLRRLLPVRSKVQGTRSYMSPEQIRGKTLDQRTDIYSFGCMLQELVTGKPPFTGNNTNELLKKHLRQAPPSIAVANGDVTPEFAQLVRRMLAKEPDGRPQTMDEVLGELNSVAVLKKVSRTAQE